MKNMRGRILRKLKFISTPTRKPVVGGSLSFQTNTTSNLVRQTVPTLIIENFTMSEIPSHVKEETFLSAPNADSQEKLESKSEENGTIIAVSECKDNLPLLPEFEEDRCPPGGRDGLVLYTTSLRGIRKTFEDCNTIRFLLESFRVVYSERDVSMHLEYREELWGVLGGRVVPPRLFVRGRCIGGADEVVGLHEKGMLKNLLQGIPLVSSCNNPCRGCAGIRFLMCSTCNGSRKVTNEEESDGPLIKCPDCNENGLIKCSVCS
ncbi:hypothetical protein ABFS82_12G158400 [Erythranthe guttata]